MNDRRSSSEKRLDDVAMLARSALVEALPIEDIGALLERLDVIEAAPPGGVDFVARLTSTHPR